MTEAQIYWLFYAFFLLVRIPANVKRCRIPLMRGPGYFFNTRVPPDFFDGPGRALLRRYRAMIFVPFLLDAAALPLIYRSGRPVYLLYLAVADIVLALVNHIAALKRAIRAAKAFEIEAAPPVSAVKFSLVTRRLRDYTSVPLEALAAGLNLGALAMVAGGPLEDFAFPLVMLYVQAGLLLLKRALVAGRTTLPSEDAEAYLQWRESHRRLLTKSCDTVRLMVAAAMASVALDVDRTVMVLATVLLLVVWTVWYWRQLRRFMELYTRARPAPPPPTLEAQTPTPAVVCYRPETPLSFVRGARGWALNLANRRSQIGLVYLAGWAVLAILALAGARVQ